MKETTVSRRQEKHMLADHRFLAMERRRSATALMPVSLPQTNHGEPTARKLPTMQPNTKRVIKRVIEGRKYVVGIFEKDFNGFPRLTAIVDGSYQDAVAMLTAGRTDSGNSFKGFKKVK